jgi:putative membrane protein
MTGAPGSLVAGVPLTNILRGFLMGSADIVPGVSGGTVALVLGIYERLVHNIHTGAGVLGAALRGRIPEAAGRWRQIEWAFLLSLLAGIAIAVVSLARLLEALLEDHPQAIAGLFFGLIAGSIVIAWKLVGRWAPSLYATTAIVALGAFFVLGLRSGDVANPSTPIFFAAGTLAIVAMILPGISGSFILLMIGMYDAVLAAVNDRELTTLLVLALGAVVGLAGFSTILDRLLRDHHDLTMAVLVGIMVGSLRVLWPWPDGTDTAALGAPTNGIGPLLLALVGVAAVTAIGRFAAERPMIDRPEGPSRD